MEATAEAVCCAAVAIGHGHSDVVRVIKRVQAPLPNGAGHVQHIGGRCTARVESDCRRAVQLTLDGVGQPGLPSWVPVTTPGIHPLGVTLSRVSADGRALPLELGGQSQRELVMAQAGTEPVTEQHGIPPVDRVRRMIAMARPVLGRCVIRGHLEGEARRQPPSALAMTLVQEPLELGDRNRVARDPERLDGAREPIDDLRAWIGRIRADLDGHLAALHAAPVDVGQAVGAQADTGAAVAQDGEAHADARPRLVAEGQAPGVAIDLAPGGRVLLGAESRQWLEVLGIGRAEKRLHDLGPRHVLQGDTAATDLAHRVQDARLRPLAAFGTARCLPLGRRLLDLGA
jgi:hypothetical protein